MNSNTSHISPILATNLKESVGDLPERAHPYRVHQHLKHVGVVDDGFLQTFEHGG
jgi:hypothetical protein